MGARNTLQMSSNGTNGMRLTPNWRIFVRRPDWTTSAAAPTATLRIFSLNTDTTVMSFAPEPGLGTYQFDIRYASAMGCPVTSFNYETDISNPDSSFSMTLLPFADYTTKIALHDLVYFFDDTYGVSDNPEFIGLVTDRRYSSRMTEHGMVRGITISGKSMAALMTQFSFNLDQRVFAGALADTASKTLQANLQAKYGTGQSILGIAKTLRDSFVQVVSAATGVSAGVASILQTRLKFEEAGDLTVKYPKIFSLYTVGDNTLWNVLENVVDPPWNEAFFRFDGADLVMVIRPTAYLTPASWSDPGLTVTKLDPLFITAVDVGTSSAEAYTVFGATFPGSGVDWGKTLVIDDFRQHVKFSSQMARFGYKAMQVERHFLDRSQEASAGLSTLLDSTNTELRDMYEHAPDMYSGSIQLKPMQRTPRIGEKVSLGAVDFYVENVSRSWSMGQSFGITLRVSRGAVYNADGTFGRSAGEDLMRKLN